MRRLCLIVILAVFALGFFPTPADARGLSDGGGIFDTAPQGVVKIGRRSYGIYFTVNRWHSGTVPDDLSLPNPATWITISVTLYPLDGGLIDRFVSAPRLELSVPRQMRTFSPSLSPQAMPMIWPTQSLGYGTTITNLPWSDAKTMTAHLTFRDGRRQVFVEIPNIQVSAIAVP